MTFTEALSAVFNDSEKVTRAHWNSRAIYLLLEDAKLQMVGGIELTTGKARADGKPYPFVLDEQDYYAEDWEVVE